MPALCQDSIRAWTPYEQDLCMRRGATFDPALTWYQDEEGGTPVDFTGYSAWAEFRTGDGVVMTLSTATGSMSLDDQGVMCWLLSADQVSSIEWRRADVVTYLQEPGGAVRAAVVGKGVVR